MTERCSCLVPPSYLPIRTTPLFVRENNGAVSLAPEIGVGARYSAQHIHPDCPFHGTVAQEREAYNARRNHLLAWRTIRKAWPKARRDAAAAIDVKWYEYADPEGEYWRWWPLEVDRRR